jgi:hypothetical protein
MSSFPDPAFRRPRFQRARRRGWVPLVLLGALLPGLATAAPDWRRPELEPQNLVRPSGISVERCANIVRRETGGRVLSASPAERGGQRGCEVRVLVDGKRVKSLFVDSEGHVRGR